MNENKTIKEVYGLEYEVSEQKSGLAEWYNRLIDKTIHELDEFDVGRMIRQGILEEIAIERGIAIFEKDSTAGGLYEGDVLESLCLAIRKVQLPTNQLSRLINAASKAKSTMDDCEWEDDEEKRQFSANLETVCAMKN